MLVGWTQDDVSLTPAINYVNNFRRIHERAKQRQRNTFLKSNVCAHAPPLFEQTALGYF
jgi:hypothetical protein